MTRPLTDWAIQARRAFRVFYSKTTAEILKRVAKGEDTTTVAFKVGVSPASVATTKGNLTRGVYEPYAYTNDNGEVVGSCEF